MQLWLTWCRAVVAVALAAAALAAPAHALTVGLGDQYPATLSDPRFTALGLTEVRLVVPWDGVWTEPDAITAWLKAAAAQHLHPLIAFEHSAGDKCPSLPCTLPSAADYQTAVQAFHDTWPSVDSFEPWNEANHSTQPTARAPGHAAQYYEALLGVCPGCTVVGADVLAGENVPTWLATFKSQLTSPVKIWGFHNYADANRFRTTDTDEFLSLVDGEVWDTEVGGIVQFDRTHDAWPYDLNRAAQAVDYAFNIAAIRPQITRMYLYNWVSGLPMDTGLMAADGSMRPAYYTLALRLNVDLPDDQPIPPSAKDQAANPPTVDPATDTSPMSSSLPPNSTPDAGAPSSSPSAAGTPARRALLAAYRMRLHRDGSVVVRVSCATGPGSCAGVLRGAVCLRGLSLYKLAAGARARFRLFVTGAGRRKLRLHGHAVAGLTINGRPYLVTITRK